MDREPVETPSPRGEPAGPIGDTATSSKTWIAAVAVAVIVGLFIFLAR